MKLLRWARLGAIIVLGTALVGYAGTCAWLRLNGRNLIFARNLPVVPESVELQLHPETVQIGNVEHVPVFAWVIHSLPADSAANAWVLYFHGSGADLTWDQELLWLFRGLGFNILAPEYPGYAGKPGQPTEKSVEDEAQVAFDYLRNFAHVPPANVAIWGGSLGTGVAVDLASHVQAGALVLVSPYTSIVEVGEQQYPFLPVSLISTDRFESDKKIASVHMPVFIHHTYEDGIFPVAMARRLFDLTTSPKRLMVSHGVHAATPYAFWMAVQQFLNTTARFHLVEVSSEPFGRCP